MLYFVGVFHSVVFHLGEGGRKVFLHAKDVMDDIKA